MNSTQTAIALMLTSVLTAGSVEAQPTGAPPKPQPPATTMPTPTGKPSTVTPPAKLAGMALMDLEAVSLAQEMALVAGAKASMMADHADLAHTMAMTAAFDAHYAAGFGDHQSAEAREKARATAAQQAERDRESRLYAEGRQHLDASRWERAAERFNDVITMKGRLAEAALYYKAYSQDRLGQRAEALATLQTLSRDYASSRWLQQAKALEAEVRRNAGQPPRPQDQSDEDLKLMALNALQHQTPEQAVPMLEKLLSGTASPKLKERALFVLAQSDSPQAREVLRNIAKGNSTPELQSRAITYLGTHGGRESRAILSEVYASTNDVDMKKRILRAFMTGGEKERLLNAAQTEQNPELRATAVQQLGVMGAHTELGSLYQKETTVEVKKQIIRAMFVGGNSAKMIELAKSEQNPELRREAIRNLGMMGSKGTADALVEIYNADKDLTVRKAVIQALAMNDNAAALVSIARKEQDPALKTEIVRRLSHMNSKIATDYMLEILNK
jgi:HEAT repeat protein